MYRKNFEVLVAGQVAYKGLDIMKSTVPQDRMHIEYTATIDDKWWLNFNIACFKRLRERVLILPISAYKGP
jgi:hypothetical protein